ncbi:hypothetical protein Riv7116_5994 [Rivularia sp. PCC 7116]|uniref:hypothetical protein n=1 Tax=Rivularia sp. PCC 7116 TaxID=373994 RepID=UPI00029EE3AB|nr:hypothetical protein [Rivularia sp. PCC 7116]AFY58355.1 hypothetical protein Riv7116_5994 [Rivularia sp. PCC 7116]
MDLDNWVNIATEVGAIGENGDEFSSSQMAREAIEIILGKDNLKEAVRYYVAHKPGKELLRGVLWQLHPYSAMEECYRIFKESSNLDEKIDAVELLRVVADKRVLKWVPEFLKHENPGIQNWGIGIVEQLLFSHLCDEEDVAEILQQASKHHSKYLRDKADDMHLIFNTEEELDFES